LWLWRWSFWRLNWKLVGDTRHLVAASVPVVAVMVRAAALPADVFAIQTSDDPAVRAAAVTVPVLAINYQA